MHPPAQLILPDQPPVQGTHLIASPRPLNHHYDIHNAPTRAVRDPTNMS